MNTMTTIYAFIGRLAHRLATPVLRVYGLRMVRVRALVVTPDNQVMLVRSWFGHQRWSLPGGGIHRHEQPAEAASRELHEETGVFVKPSDLASIGTFNNADSAAPFMTDCYYAYATRQPITHPRFEVLEAAWFPLNRLPANRSQTVDKALALIANRPR